MAKEYVISLVARDRIGILAAASSALDELGGNLLEVNQAVMRNYFSMMIAASFPDERDPEVIVEHLRDVCRPFQVEVILRDPQKEVQNTADNLSISTEEYILTISGSDRPGVMRVVSKRLSTLGVLIVDLRGQQLPDSQFLVVLELAIPAGCNVLDLHRQLLELPNVRDLTIKIQHVRMLAATASPCPVVEH